MDQFKIFLWLIIQFDQPGKMSQGSILKLKLKMEEVHSNRTCEVRKLEPSRAVDLRIVLM